VLCLACGGNLSQPPPARNAFPRPLPFRTGGNLLLPIVIHWQLNVAFWPEAQPWENYLNVALAVALVWAHRDVMFSRSRGATTVIPA